MDANVDEHDDDGIDVLFRRAPCSSIQRPRSPPERCSMTMLTRVHPPASSDKNVPWYLGMYGQKASCLGFWLSRLQQSGRAGPPPSPPLMLPTPSPPLPLLPLDRGRCWEFKTRNSCSSTDLCFESHTTISLTATTRRVSTSTAFQTVLVEPVVIRIGWGRGRGSEGAKEEGRKGIV